MSRRALLAALFLGAVHLAGGAARAASDYDFGVALMTKFGFDEEAEKFFTGLQQGTNKDIRLTGTFGLGGIKKLRADRADDPAKAARLYVEAKKLINEFLRDASSNHPDRGAANAALVEIQKRYLRELQGIINDPNATRDAKDKALREAKGIFTTLISPLREDKKRAFSRLKPHLPWPERPTAAAARALNTAVDAMVRYYGMVLQQAELFQKSGTEGKKIAKDLIKEMEADAEFYEQGELAGVVLKINYELGRAYVAAGDLKKAAEHFDMVIDQETYGLPAATRQFVELHQLYAFFKKANAYFDAEKWDDTIKVVDDMFGALPQALNEDQGNGALLFKAESLFRKDPPDYPGAIREASKVIEKGKGFWPNNANQLLAKVLAALESDAQSVAMSAEILHGVAVGEVQLAYRERDPSKQQEHFEKAIYWLQKTIAATRAEGVKLQTRLKHGPTAWFELGSVYAKMGLWYEARFSFEAVLRYYAKDVVGRSIAELPA
ncbi:MAG: tetratricopeptide repeat protein, partial [Planctomycetota bacterium]